MQTCTQAFPNQEPRVIKAGMERQKTMHMTTTSCESESQSGLSRQEKVHMACTSCGSEKQKEFGAEMNIHFPGREGRDKPVVWVFPKIIVCFGCGTTAFALPEAELRKLESDVSA
jgi:hypothetical protein